MDGALSLPGLSRGDVGGLTCGLVGAAECWGEGGVAADTPTGADTDLGGATGERSGLGIGLARGDDVGVDGGDVEAEGRLAGSLMCSGFPATHAPPPSSMDWVVLTPGGAWSERVKALRRGSLWCAIPSGEDTALRIARARLGGGGGDGAPSDERIPRVVALGALEMNTLSSSAGSSPPPPPSCTLPPATSFTLVDAEKCGLSTNLVC